MVWKRETLDTFCSSYFDVLYVPSKFKILLTGPGTPHIVKACQKSTLIRFWSKLAIISTCARISERGRKAKKFFDTENAYHRRTTS